MAACGGLGNEAGGGEEEDEEGQAHTAHDDAVAQQEVDVLLDKGQHQQRQHGTHINAPIKPVEEAAVGMAAKIHHLPGKGESEGQGGVRAPCRVPVPPLPQRHFLDQWVGVLALSSSRSLNRCSIIFVEWMNKPFSWESPVNDQDILTQLFLPALDTRCFFIVTK